MITPSTSFMELCPSEVISMKIMSAVQLKNRQRYFHETWYKCEQSSDNVQRTRIETPTTFFTELCPSEIINMKIVLVLKSQNRQRYIHETRYKYKPLPDDVHRIRTVTPSAIFVELCPFEIFVMKILSHCVTLIPLRIFS